MKPTSATAASPPVRRHRALDDLSLVATVKGAGGPAMALLRRGNRWPLPYGPGAQLTGAVDVLLVLDGFVLVRSDGALVLIGVGDAPGAPPDTARPSTSGRPSSKDRNNLTATFAAGVQQTGPRTYYVQRGALELVLGSISALARDAQIMPSARNGRIEGFRLVRLRHGSLLTTIGLQAGDTIRAVNGHAIDSVDAALEAFRNLRHASHLTLALSRGETTVNLDYAVGNAFDHR